MTIEIRQNLHKGEYHSVGGDATHIVFNFPGFGALYIGSLLSLSYQVYRDKTPVYNLGNTNIDGFAIGKRYVAGSIIKTVFLDDDITNFLQIVADGLNLNRYVDNLYQLKLEKKRAYHHLMYDDVLPFDIIVLISSEYGSWSVSEVIYGATLISSGTVHSIHDLITESTMSFVARDARQTRDDIGSTKYGAASSYDRKASSLSDYLPDTVEMILPNDSSSRVLTLDEIYALAHKDFLSDDAITDKETFALFHIQRLIDGDTLTDDEYRVIPKEYREMIANSTGMSSIIDYGDQYEGSSSFIDVDKSSMKYRKGGAVNETSVPDGDTVTFRGVLNTSGTLYKNPDNTNSGDFQPINKTPEGELTLRLGGIDAPETKKGDEEGQPFADEAHSFFLNYLKEGKWERDVQEGMVSFPGHKTYGRAVVFNFNYAFEAVSKGYAHYIPNMARKSGATVEQMRSLEEAQISAREQKLGLWAYEPVEMPDAYRRRVKNDNN